MSLLDQIGSMVGQATGGEGGGGLTQLLMGLIQNYEGGLPGLVAKLGASGLGAQVASWVGKGENLPVSAEQIQSALGDGIIGQLAEKAGLSKEALSSALATLLPQVIDQLTPDGQVGEHSLVQEGLGALGKLFG